MATKKEDRTRRTQNVPTRNRWNGWRDEVEWREEEGGKERKTRVDAEEAGMGFKNGPDSGAEGGRECSDCTGQYMQLETIRRRQTVKPKLWPWSRVKSRDGPGIFVYTLWHHGGCRGIWASIPGPSSLFLGLHLTTELDSALNDPAAAINWQLEHMGGRD